MRKETNYESQLAGAAGGGGSCELELLLFNWGLW
jgi:hypothetical protein